MKKNGIKNKHEIYDINHEGKWPGHDDIHECPRIVGTVTDFEFREMSPIQIFLEKVQDNNRSWLRIYEHMKEEERLYEIKEQWNTPFEPNETQSCNRDWPYLMRNYLKMGQKLSYMSISKLLRYGIEQNE